MILGVSKKIIESDALSIMKKAGFQPLVRYRNGDTPWRSKCLRCKRIVFPRFRQVRDRGYGCRYCSGRTITVADAKRDFRAAKLKPLVAFPGASKKWKSKCLVCKSTVAPRLSDIRMGHSGCKKCAHLRGGRKRRLDQNPTRAGVTTNFEEVLGLMRQVNLEPLEPYRTSQTKWKCKCLKCGAIVAPKYNQIKQGGGGCKACFIAKQPNIRKLDSQTAVSKMQERNLQPLEPYPGAMKPWRCKCLDCGTEIAPTYAHIQQGRKGCKVCGYRKNAAARRTPEAQAITVMKDAGFEPLEPYKHRHHPWKSRCLRCENTVSPHYGRIVQGGGCRFCSGLVVDPIKAIEKMINAGLQPLEDYPGAGKPWKSKCLKCNRIVKPRYSQLAYKIGGCKFCASHGYSFSKPGLLYLITHDDLLSHKVGITNVESKEDRLAKHLYQGWRVFKKRIYRDGNVAYEIEQATIEWLREECSLPIHLDRSQMPQGGWTETVDAREIDLQTIWSRVVSLSKKVQGPSQ